MNFGENYNKFLRENFSSLKNHDQQDFFKAKMMLAGLFNLLILNVLNIFIINVNDYQFYLSCSNIIIWSLNLILTLKLGNIRIPYKLMAIYGPISTSLHALFGGGLYSSYIFWFPIICLGMSLFLDRNYATMVAVYSMISISVFAYLQISGNADFKKEIENISVYFDYTNLMSVFTMLVLILFFFFTKENLDILWKKQKENQIDELEQLLEQRTMEVKKMRNEMAIEFHDEMGNKLALISTYINVLQVQNFGASEKLMDYLEKINLNAKSVYEGTRDFIWTIEAEHANFFELGVYLRDFGERLFLPVDVDFMTQSLSLELKKVQTTFIENHQIILIVKEAMTNAMKYSETKKIDLIFEVDSEFVSLHVKDYGIGFDPDALNRIFGINNMKKRAQKINSELIIDTEPGKGVEIILKYKIPQNR